MGQPLKKTIAVNKSNPYDGYETQTTTSAKSKEINTPIEQFRKHVHEAMEQGLEKFGVKVENQPIIKINEKTNKKVVTLFSGFLFIEDGYHETHQKVVKATWNDIAPLAHCQKGTASRADLRHSDGTCTNKR